MRLKLTFIEWVRKYWYQQSNPKVPKDEAVGQKKQVGR